MLRTYATMQINYQREEQSKNTDHKLAPAAPISLLTTEGIQTITEKGIYHVASSSP